MPTFDVHKVERARECPGCGAALDGALHVGEEEHAPTPGDVSICMYCRDIMIFEEEAFRLPTDEELSDILEDKTIRKAIRALEEFHRRYGPPGRG